MRGKRDGSTGAYKSSEKMLSLMERRVIYLTPERKRSQSFPNIRNRCRDLENAHVARLIDLPTQRIDDHKDDLIKGGASLAVGADIRERIDARKKRLMGEKANRKYQNGNG